MRALWVVAAVVAGLALGLGLGWRFPRALPDSAVATVQVRPSPAPTVTVTETEVVTWRATEVVTETETETERAEVRVIEVDPANDGDCRDPEDQGDADCYEEDGTCAPEYPDCFNPTIYPSYAPPCVLTDEATVRVWVSDFVWERLGRDPTEEELQELVAAYQADELAACEAQPFP